MSILYHTFLPIQHVIVIYPFVLILKNVFWSGPENPTRPNGSVQTYSHNGPIRSKYLAKFGNWSRFEICFFRPNRTKTNQTYLYNFYKYFLFNNYIN